MPPRLTKFATDPLGRSSNQPGAPAVSPQGDSREVEMPTDSLPLDTKLRLYRSVLRLRRSEETLAELYTQQQMRTPTHFGIGQEAVAAGVCEALDPQDVVYSHHRCHNHYLARGGSVV